MGCMAARSTCRDQESGRKQQSGSGRIMGSILTRTSRSSSLGKLPSSVRRTSDRSLGPSHGPPRCRSPLRRPRPLLSLRPPPSPVSPLQPPRLLVQRVSNTTWTLTSILQTTTVTSTSSGTSGYRFFLSEFHPCARLFTPSSRHMALLLRRMHSSISPHPCSMTSRATTRSSACRPCTLARPS